MGVYISNVEPRYPWMPGNVTSNLVNEKFEQSTDYADEAFSDAQSALDILKSLFPISVPTTDISYEYINASLGAVIGNAPDEPSSSISKPTPPSIGDLETVTIPSITIPDPPGDPAATFIYNEASYQSQLLIDLEAALLSYVQNGGTGLAADIEAAIWARAQARQEISNERTYSEAFNHFAARGFTLPPGALTGRLLEAVAEQTRADAQMNYEIMIAQAKLAQTNTHFTITSSIQLVGQEREFFDRVANRAFNKAKALVDVVINLYNAKMSGYIARINGKRVEADIAKIRGELQISKNSNTVDIFNAMIAKYDTELKAEISIVETIGKIYGYKVVGYEAKARVAIADLSAQVEIFKGRIAQSDNQTRLAISEAEIVLRAYIEAAKVQVAAAEGAANVSAQLAASALNSVNASANLGFNQGFSRSDGVSASTSVSESAIKSETEQL